MADVKWIKITTNIFDDEKILLIEAMPDADAIIVIWFKLLTLAGKSNNCGFLTINDRIPYTDEMLATIFRRPLATVRLALSVFEQFGMISIINDTITIPKWEVHQNIEGLERIREQNRERKRKQREREKLLLTSGEDVSRDSSREVTQQNKNKNKNKNIDIDIDIESKSKKKDLHSNASLRPTLSEIEAYIIEKSLNVDAKRFYDYFEAGDWVDSKGNPVRNWKQRLITWSGRGNGNDIRAGYRERNGIREADGGRGRSDVIRGETLPPME